MTEVTTAVSANKIADENVAVRSLVREAMSHAKINQRQLMLMLYLLAQNVEDIQHMRVLTSTIRELRDDLFVTDKETRRGQKN